MPNRSFNVSLVSLCLSILALSGCMHRRGGIVGPGIVGGTPGGVAGGVLEGVPEGGIALPLSLPILFEPAVEEEVVVPDVLYSYELTVQEKFAPTEPPRQKTWLEAKARKVIARSVDPEIAKKDCQQLIDGVLLFKPSTTMRQGHPYLVFARLSRNSGVNITEGLDDSQFVIVKQTVSCKVSMSLDSEEPSAFTIEKMPLDRKDDQVLEPNKFSQWDWRVTPKKHGPLHLLLYVTPMLYVDGVGEGLKQFKQPPRIITVMPDYWYESGAFLKGNWPILSGLLTAVFIPLFLWFRTGIIDWLTKRAKGKESVIVIPK
jgi:hypothetical protein